MLLRPRYRYFGEQEIDPDTIWIGLCEGNKKSVACTKAFFSDYVENSVRVAMVLGPEEYVEQRMVNSASTLLEMWRKLVKEADLTVLKDKRHEEPQAADKWRLRFHGHGTGNGRAPTYSATSWEISQVRYMLWKIEVLRQADLSGTSGSRQCLQSNTSLPSNSRSKRSKQPMQIPS
jgi:hypothetical protein